MALPHLEIARAVHRLNEFYPAEHGVVIDIGAGGKPKQPSSPPSSRSFIGNTGIASHCRNTDDGSVETPTKMPDWCRVAATGHLFLIATRVVRLDSRNAAPRNAAALEQVAR